MRYFLILILYLIFSLCSCGINNPIANVPEQKDKNCDPYLTGITDNNWLSIYPTDGEKIREIISSEGCLDLKCHPGVVSNRK